MVGVAGLDFLYPLVQCGPQVLKADPSEPHRRVSSLPKDVPHTAASDRADLSFLPALRSRPFELSYTKESPSTPPDLIELSPTNYGSAPPPLPSPADEPEPSFKRPGNPSSNSAPSVTTKAKSHPLVFEDGPVSRGFHFVSLLETWC